MVHLSSESNRGPKVGIVIPSLGQHIDFLNRAVNSVLEQQMNVHILLVFPKSSTDLVSYCAKNKLEYIFDTGIGFMSAYNLAIMHLEDLGIEIFGTIGDDDELLQSSISSMLPRFDDPNVVATVGHCWYINADGKTIFHNKSRTWLLPYMHFLPDVLPAPGALYRLSAWKEVGGFDTRYKFASDYDFWLKIRGTGLVKRVEAPMSLFRWHSGGLTGKNRKAAREETKIIRRKHTKMLFWPLLFVTELVTMLLGEYVLKKSMKSDYEV
jgi:GT2 family glycosyltransferase